MAALLCVVLPFVPVAPASAADDDATSSFGPTPAPIGFDAAAAAAYDDAEADAAAAAAAAVLMPPAFAATCAMLRALAPSLATLVFLETLRPSFKAMEQYLQDGGGDDDDDAAAATAAAAAAVDGWSSAGGVAKRGRSTTALGFSCWRRCARPWFAACLRSSAVGVDAPPRR